MSGPHTTPPGSMLEARPTNHARVKCGCGQWVYTQQKGTLVSFPTRCQFCGKDVKP